ncbi:Tetratricopeptide repeat 12 [Gossypium australe]|uniref:Tetratricopeptide repeat 12 n=1 Tax=Gossypium australe TaxID=47621 RepID=A0A5B6URC8_9ROSI|nr:Tetratricopeptide repeat 12 [Gossypium australe]
MAMASLPSSPPAPSPPSISASHSESSITLATALLPPQAQVVATTVNGTLNVDDQKPQIANHFAVLDNPENIEKYKKFEADYTRRLMAKYFSKKNFYGGNVFDEKTTIDSETILSSRWPCTRSFADPMNAFKDPNNGGSNAEALK